jgi:hypothetical protein
MLDMLGLNTKLGHPVSRAFQRRSTIHDAPINLMMLDGDHQYWTLEAAPVFSPCGGVFEGYEGILTPVVSASETSEADDDDAPLFLDEMDEPDTRIASRPSFAKEASVLQSGGKKAGTSGESHTRENPADTSDSDNGTPANPLADMINNTAAAMVREAVADALTPLSPQEEAARYGTAHQATPSAPNTPSSNPAPNPAQATEAARPVFDREIQSTLTLLEEALARLSDASRHGGEAQVQLQSEIAMACLRTLKAQLARNN